MPWIVILLLELMISSMLMFEVIERVVPRLVSPSGLRILQVSGRNLFLGG